MNSATTGRAVRPIAPERSASLSGSIVKGRYKVYGVSAVTRAVVLYMAEDVRHGRPVTLKVLRDEFAADPAFVAAVRDQAWTLAVFAHVHRGVARVYECDVTDTGTVFVALEPARGNTLREVIDAGGAFGAAAALRIASRVGEALEALHHNKILHGQLGPESVLMATDDEGLERVTLVGVELTAAYRTPVGVRLRDASSLVYRAPEQVADGETTVATDVYALGMLLRDLVTGGRRRDPAGAGAETEPLPPAIEHILATALQAPPERRYPDISVMLNDMWGAHAALAEPEPRPRTPKPRPDPNRRAHPPRPRFTVRMAATVAAGGVIALIGWGAPSDRIASPFRARVTAPPATAVPVDQGPTRAPVQDASPEVAPATPTVSQETSNLPESAPVVRPVRDESATLRPAPLVGRPERASTSTLAGRGGRESRIDAIVEPRTPLIAPPTPRSSPGTPTERPTPVERPAQREPVVRNDGDGSAVVDWLLQKR